MPFQLPTVSVTDRPATRPRDPPQSTAAAGATSPAAPRRTVGCASPTGVPASMRWSSAAASFDYGSPTSRSAGTTGKHSAKLVSGGKASKSADAAYDRWAAAAAAMLPPRRWVEPPRLLRPEMDEGPASRRGLYRGGFAYPTAPPTAPPPPAVDDAELFDETLPRRQHHPVTLQLHAVKMRHAPDFVGAVAGALLHDPVLRLALRDGLRLLDDLSSATPSLALSAMQAMKDDVSKTNDWCERVLRAQRDASDKRILRAVDRWLAWPCSRSETRRCHRR